MEGEHEVVGVASRRPTANERPRAGGSGSSGEEAEKIERGGERDDGAH